MPKKSMTVYKSNKLVEASYQTFSLVEQLALLACIAKSDPATLTSDTAIEMTVSEFAELGGIDKTDAYDDLKRVAERLFSRYMIIDAPDPDDSSLRRTRTRWVHSIDYYDGEGRVRLFFSPKVIPYLADLKNKFTRYKLEHVADFKSKYGVRLYELLVQWQSAGRREIEIDWLRDTWQLGGKYRRIADLKKWVIEPAIRDINNYSNLWVKAGQRKRGRRIVAIQLQFGLKQPKPKQQQKIKKQTLQDYITRHARPGESWEAATARLRPEFVRKTR
jgi:plasmid replication initiation protein